MKTYRLKAIIAESLITEGAHSIYAEVSAYEVLEALRLETSLFQDHPTIFGVPFPAVAEMLRQYGLRGGKHPITVDSVKETFAEFSVLFQRRIAQRRQSDRRYNNVRRHHQDRWIHRCIAAQDERFSIWGSAWCPDCGIRRTTIYDRRAPIPRVNWDRREKRRRSTIERRVGG